MTPEELKKSILQQAIQGKLVEQRSEEGTAEELYRKLIKIKIKTQINIEDEDLPFEIPNSWMWFRHNELFEIVGGSQPPKSHFRDEKKDGYIRLYQIRDYGDKPVPIYVPQKEVSKFTVKGDILLARYGGSLGKVFFAENGAYNVAMARVTPLFTGNSILTKYMYYYYLAPLYQSLVKNNSRSAQAGFNKEDLDSLLLPLPPLAEQKRIVAKIEELMPYIDRYGQAWSKLEDFNKRFPGDMQKSILQIAIQGKLVEQRPEEGTGEDLYKQIQFEKQRLIKAGKIKKGKPLPEITEDEKPFDIPESWMWVRLGDCTSYAQRKEKISANKLSSDMWSLDLEDIEKDTGRIINISQASDRNIIGDKVRFFKGQILYSKLRPYLKKILVAPDDGVCSSEIIPFVSYGNIDHRYLIAVLKSPHVDHIINSVTYGVKMPRVGTETMVNLIIPLPPIAEQRRIVAKLEEILPLCERLK